jgi:hypothetical protein
MRLGIASPMAALAFNQRIGPVKFDQPFNAGAGKAMKAIDILCDNSPDFPGPLQADNCSMNGIWLRIAKRVMAFQLVIPVFDPRCFRCHEIVEEDRLAPCPDTLRTSKIGNATTSGDSGSGKDQRLLRCSEIVGKGHSGWLGAIVVGECFRKVDERGIASVALAHLDTLVLALTRTYKTTHGFS